MNLNAAAKWWKLSPFISPDQGRLAGAIRDAWIDLDRQTIQQPVEAQTRQNHAASILTEPWARAAYHFLLQAEERLANRDLQQGWVAVQSAHRLMILNPRDSQRAGRIAIALRREVGKLSGWRAKAIADLLSVPENSADPGAKVESMKVYDAVALRDDQFNTTYFKIALRRRHLWHLFYLLCAILALVLFLSWRNLLPDFLNDTRRLGMVILFGALGGAISVALGLIRADVSAKIPAQQIGAFVVWMRPIIGASVALISFVILNTEDAGKLLSLLHLDLKDPSILLVAFVAGFSERFIVGAIDRLSEKSNDGKPS